MAQPDKSEVMSVYHPLARQGIYDLLSPSEGDLIEAGQSSLGVAMKEILTKVEDAPENCLVFDNARLELIDLSEYIPDKDEALNVQWITTHKLLYGMHLPECLDPLAKHGIKSDL